MVDLYNIPGDNHTDFRLKKFVEYQHEVPATDFRFICAYIDRHNLNRDEIVFLFWLLSVTYSEISSIFLFDVLYNKRISYFDFWLENKENINFGSAKKYNKNNDLFPELILSFDSVTNKKYFNWVSKGIVDDPVKNYKIIHDKILSIKNAGRFSADLFLQVFVHKSEYFGFKTSQPFNLDWKSCANLTSGIFNIFYEDEKANEFDKTGIIKDFEYDYLSDRLKDIQKKIIEMYPDENPEVYNFITKICSFRNLFKNARYGGFHHDRELEVIKNYEKNFPDYQRIWNECYEIRKEIFQHRFLGELNGWEGIRPERKKYWLKYGITCAEKNADELLKINEMKLDYGLFEV